MYTRGTTAANYKIDWIAAIDGWYSEVKYEDGAKSNIESYREATEFKLGGTVSSILNV